METLDIRELEELARDYTETRRRILFVLGALDEAAMQVFLDMRNHAPVAIEPAPVPGGGGGVSAVDLRVHACPNDSRDCARAGWCQCGRLPDYRRLSWACAGCNSKSARRLAKARKRAVPSPEQERLGVSPRLGSPA